MASTFFLAQIFLFRFLWLMPPKKNQILLTVCSPAHNKTIGVTIITIWYLCEICYIFQNFGLHRDHSSGCARPKFWIEKYCKLDQWRTWIPRYAEEANWSIFIPSFLDFVSYINSSKLLFIFFENYFFFENIIFFRNFFLIFFAKMFIWKKHLSRRSPKIWEINY